MVLSFSQAVLRKTGGLVHLEKKWKAMENWSEDLKQSRKCFELVLRFASYPFNQKQFTIYTRIHAHAHTNVRKHIHANSSTHAHAYTLADT
jgi:hypothetical protein